MWLYKLTNKTTGKQYIGTSVKPVSYRISRHVYAAKKNVSNMAISCAIRKYGIESFSVETIGESSDHDSLLRMEAAAISEQGTLAPNGYNVTAGGRGCVQRPCSQETRDRMSANRKGRTPWNKGKGIWGAIRARRAVGSHVGGPAKGSKPWNVGKKTGPMPEEAKKLIAEGVRRVRAARFWSTRPALKTNSGGNL